MKVAQKQQLDLYRSLFCCKMFCFSSLVATNNSIYQCLPFIYLFIVFIFSHNSHLLSKHHSLLDAEMLPTFVLFFSGKQYQQPQFFSTCFYIFNVLFTGSLSQWLIFKFLGIPYLVGKIKFKLLFHGPSAE